MAFTTLRLLLDANTISGRMVFVNALASLKAFPVSKSTFTSTSFVSFLCGREFNKIMIMVKKLTDGPTEH